MISGDGPNLGRLFFLRLKLLCSDLKGVADRWGELGGAVGREVELGGAVGRDVELDGAVWRDVELGISLFGNHLCKTFMFQMYTFHECVQSKPTSRVNHITTHTSTPCAWYP